jgi:hypothetical protein
MKHIAKLIAIKLEKTLPKMPMMSTSLPFIMQVYKLHKKSYRWLTNAHGSIFTLTTHVVTYAFMKLMILFKEWSKIRIYGYQRFFNIKTSMFWIVGSIIDFTINLLENM